MPGHLIHKLLWGKRDPSERLCELKGRTRDFWKGQLSGSTYMCSPKTRLGWKHMLSQRDACSKNACVFEDGSETQGSEIVWLMRLINLCYMSKALSVPYVTCQVLETEVHENKIQIDVIAKCRPQPRWWVSEVEDAGWWAQLMKVLRG